MTNILTPEQQELLEETLENARDRYRDIHGDAARGDELQQLLTDLQTMKVL